MILQRCSHCKVEKPLSEFHKSRNTKNGVKNQCKMCVSNGYQDHKNHITSYNRRYYQEHKEEIKAYAKSYRCENPNVLQNWKAENKERLREYARTPKARVNGKNYKARKRNALGKFTSDEWMKLLELCSYSCLRCGVQGDNLAADHIVPLKRGGSNFIKNIQPLCKPCNSSKHTSIVDYRPLWIRQVYK